MKILKLIVALGSILVANAIYATDASVTSASVSGSNSNPGYAVLVINGSNGTFVQMLTGTSGSVSTATAVTHVTKVTFTAEASDSSATGASFTVVIPAGATGTVTFAANRTNHANASASVSVDSSIYTATYTTVASGSVTLASGTHTISVSSSAGYQNGGVISNGELDVTYP